MKKRNFKLLFVCSVFVALHGCAATSALDAVASGAFFLGKVAVKGTVGATKLIYRGGKSVANGSNNTNYNNRYYAVDAPYTGGNQAISEPSCLHQDGSYTPAFKDDAGMYSC